MDSTSNNWISALKDKINAIKESALSLYYKAKSNITSLTNNTPAPLPTTTGGSKRRRSKKTKRVRFSNKRKVYKYKTMRRK